MHQKHPCVCGALQLSSDDILFILCCIESSEKQILKELGEKALYDRLVQRYVNLVVDVSNLPQRRSRKQATLELVN
jgi:hypothetical protein